MLLLYVELKTLLISSCDSPCTVSVMCTAALTVLSR